MEGIIYSGFWIFMIGSVIGFVLEGIWCVLRKGSWESHSATVWGPFCIIYGIGAVAAWLMVAVVKVKKLLFQFVSLALFIFMCVDLVVTLAALVRWQKRQLGVAASCSFESYIDAKFDDAAMTKRFPNMRFKRGEPSNPLRSVSFACRSLHRADGHFSGSILGAELETGRTV